MNSMELMLGSKLAQAAGWTLLHFVWQGCLIALLPFIVSKFVFGPLELRHCPGIFLAILAAEH